MNANQVIEKILKIKKFKVKYAELARVMGIQRQNMVRYKNSDLSEHHIKAIEKYYEISLQNDYNKNFDMNTISDRLELILKEKALKPADLARISNKSTGNIATILSGHVKPAFDFLTLLNQKLGVSIDWLLTGNGDMFIGGNPTKKPEFDEDFKDYIQDVVEKTLKEKGIE